MLYHFLIVATLLGSPPNSPAVSSVSTAAPKAVVQKPTEAELKRAELTKQFLAGKNAADAALLKRLLAGTTAIQDKGWNLSLKYRMRIANAAMAAFKKTSVDPFLLLGVGRMESDYRPLTLINKGCKGKRPRFKGQRCHADCGITQHHVRGSHRYVHAECKRLRKDFTRSFIKSAEEIARHKIYCAKNSRWDKNHWRCVLNRYNQGPFYKRQYRCTRSRYGRRIGRCLSRSIYFKKVLCFKYGAVHQKSPVLVYTKRNRTRRVDRCRYFLYRWNVADIPTQVYRVALPSASLMR